MVRMHADRSPAEEEFVRAGGVLIPVNTGHEVGREDVDEHESALDDLVGDETLAGTRDDVRYDYGIEIARPVDQMVLNLERPSHEE